jgi:SNF2 family DNA or RNA helicase
MNKYEKLVYDSILDRIKNLSKSDFIKNFDLLISLRRGRIIRLRQSLSYTKLLASAVTEYNEDLLDKNLSLSDIIKRYDDLEIPAKLESLLKLIKNLRNKEQKIVIWSNFIESLKLIKKLVQKQGYGVRLIYGATPIQNVSVSEELTRDEIIREFVHPDSGVDILIANPAACAESISLHKTCSHAIYYDLSYNCAQYLQSLDRIHRVGGSENKSAHYHFLQYEHTIDDDILMNVRQKAENMRAIIDQDYAIYSLDMFEENEELEAYERLFGK